ncbi:MAG: hypothetical protein U0796_19240 [Gemmatales bacterium]
MLQDDPLAYFITWTTYGTWMPGDERGWHDGEGLWQAGDMALLLESQLLMTEDAITLTKQQRSVVEKTIPTIVVSGAGCCMPSIAGRIMCMSS